MKKNYVHIVIVAIIIVIVAILIIALGGFVTPDNSVGPAPNSGDGVSDGSGLEQPNYQNEPSPEIRKSINSCNDYLKESCFD